MNIDSLTDNLLVNKPDNHGLVLSPIASDFQHILGSVDNSSSKVLPPAACPQDSERLLSAQTACKETDITEFIGQAAESKELNGQQTLTDNSTFSPKINNLSSSSDHTIQVNAFSMHISAPTNEQIEVESLESPKVLSENKANLDKSEESQVEVVDNSSSLFYLTGLLTEFPLAKPVDAKLNSINLDKAPLATENSVNNTTLSSIINASKKPIGNSPSSNNLLTEVTSNNELLEASNIEPSIISNQSSEPHQLIVENLTPIINDNAANLNPSTLQNKTSNSLTFTNSNQASSSQRQATKTTPLDTERTISKNNSASGNIKTHPMELSGLNKVVTNQNYKENNDQLIPTSLNSLSIDSKNPLIQTTPVVTSSAQSDSSKLNTVPLATEYPVNETRINDYFSLTNVVDASKKPIDNFHILTEVPPQNELLEASNIEPSIIINQSSEPHQLIFENLTQVINNNLANLDLSMVQNKPSDSTPFALSSQPSASQLQETKATLLDIQRNISENNSQYSMDGASANIKIHPKELGEINAKIIINKGQAELTLTIESSPVKHLIEMHIQELRHSFNDLPINLTQVTVQTNDEQTSNSFNEQFNRRQSQYDSNQTNTTSLDSELSNESNSKQSNKSLIDAYA